MKQKLSATDYPQCSLRFFLLLSATVFLLNANAQNNGKPVYIAISYIKTAPGKFNDYLKLAQTTSKKVFSYEIQQQQMLGWYLYSVLMPSGTEAEYDVVGINVSSDLQQLLDPNTTGRDLLQKAMPDMSSQQIDSIMQQFGPTRSIVKREIYQALSGTNENTPPSKYVEIDYMTPAAGKAADYVKMEETKFLPVHKQRMAMGALKGWRLAEKIMPSSTDDPYSFITANFYDNIDTMMNPKYAEAIKKAWPAEDMTKLFQQVNTVKKAQRNELWKLVDYAEQPQSK
jgi:hypothetical protein